MKKNGSFIKGALVLSIGGLLAKVLGALYRIPLTNILGSYGMGLYQLVFPPYILFLTLAQAGIPTALSKLVSESNGLGKREQGQKQFQFAFVLLLVLGLIGALAMAGFSKVIARAEGNDDTAKAFLILAPALLFVPVTNALKGYFQGNMNMVPSGVTTVIEQVVKLCVGLALAYKFMPDVTKAVYGAVFAITVSEFGSLVIMSTVYLVYKHKAHVTLVKFSRQDKAIIGTEVFYLAVPVALGGFVMQLSQVIDSVMVVNLLTVPNATELYGLWTGPVNSMLGLPIALSSGVAVSALPDITKKFVEGNGEELNKSYNSALKLTLLIALPCAFGLILLSKPILTMLYGGLTQSEIYSSAVMLSISGISVVFLAVVLTCVSVCQAVGRPYASVIILAISIVIKAVVNLLLLPLPSVNVYGSAISETLCYLFAAVCVIIYLKVKVHLALDVRTCILKPLAASLVMTLSLTVVVLYFERAIGNTLGTLAVITVCGLVYFVMISALGTFDKKELSHLLKKN